MANIGFIGWGIVGQATGKGLAKSKKNRIFWYDKYKKSPYTLDEVLGKSEFIFLCVPTPMYSDHSGIDSSIVDEVVNNVAPKLRGTDKILIIKSTVIPGTTAKYAKKYPRVKFAMIPEFLTEKRANWDFLHPARTIIGAKDRRVALRLKRLHQTALPKDAPYFLTDTTSAELAKYMANIMLAEKIMLANEFYFLAKKLGVKYDGVREMVEADRRIGSHIKAPGHDGSFGFGGKCLHPQTKIYTNESIKESRNVEIGDYVLTIDGSYQKVIKKFTRLVEEELLSVRGQGLEEFVVTKDHLVFVVRANRKYYGQKKRKFSNFNGKLELEWASADTLEKGDFIVLPRVQTGKKAFAHDVMRLFGYYVAEGHVGEKSRITLGFHKNETYYVEDIERILIKNFNIRSHRRYVGNALNLRFTSKRLATLLSENCGEHANKKKLSQKIMMSDKKGLSEFIKGYFRGDGSKSTGIYTMATISKELFYQLKLILLSLGIAFSTKITKARVDGKGVNHQKTYTIRIRNYIDIEKFGQLVGNKIDKQLKLRRKTAFFNNDFFFIPIKKIGELSYKGSVFNFEVEENNTFVVTDAVVHNCFPKDIVALLGLGRKLKVDLSVMDAIWKKNLKIRKVHDWKEIAGAVNHKNGNGDHLTNMYNNLYRV